MVYRSCCCFVFGGSSDVDSGGGGGSTDGATWAIKYLSGRVPVQSIQVNAGQKGSDVSSEDCPG